MENMLKTNFYNIYNEETNDLYFSPGRVNLIGEHIDYNGGHVLPSAISYGTYGAVSLRDDTLVKIYSEGFTKEVYEFDIKDIKKLNDFADYIKGVFYVLIKNNYNINEGLNIYIKSTMPTNAGLSSSASIELLIIYILNDLFGLNIERTKMAVLGQNVENDFILVNSGIMDQFSIVNGKKDHATLINTKTLEYSLIPLELGKYNLVIVNTNKKRGLSDSKYNERFSETRKALTILQSHYKIDHLCDLSEKELIESKSLLDELLYKRVKHVVTENIRTLNAVEVLKEGNLDVFAKLLNESHKSLKEDYEVTGIELDTLVELSIKHNAIGARMTGAGFGGCIIALVDEKDITNFISNVKEEYLNLIKIEPSFYVVETSDGTRKL